MPPTLSRKRSRSRPELLSLRNAQDAALKFARAERALRYPTISAIASAGVIPIGDSQLSDNYAAAGVSLSVPLFAGGYYAARQQAAELQAQAAEESLRDAGEQYYSRRSRHLAQRAECL